MLKHQKTHPLAIFRYRDLLANEFINNRTTLKRWIAAGLFPKPVELGPNSIGWRVAEIEAWLASRARRGETAMEAE
jgi:hypothetical protein